MTYKKNSSSNKTDWITPKYIIDKLAWFDLDPCCPPLMPWRTADTMLSLHKPHEKTLVHSVSVDGLKEKWFGRVWLNPPYGRAQDPWLEKMAAHGNGIALIPAATGTERWEKLVFPHATAICFVRGRIQFCLPDGTPATNNMHDSALVAYGEHNVIVLQESGLGHVVRLEN